MLRRITLLLAIPILGWLVPKADCSSDLFPISRQLIAQAIQVKLSADTTAPISIQPEEILLSVTPASRIPLPALAVTSFSNTSDGFMARIRCLPARDCVPFFVRLQVNRQSREIILASEARKRAEHNGPVLIPVGTLVKLTLKRGDIDLRMPVRSLASGRLGQRIRVSDDVSRKVYVARVTGIGVVESTY